MRGIEVKIGLVDIDGKIPNLALMKLSAHHKLCGDTVELTSPLFADGYDTIYASKIFDFSELPILPDKAVVGGSGFDLSVKLDDAIEGLPPDYSLYPDYDYAIGYTTRGCNRSCPWCVVPEKEGKFHIIQDDIRRFWVGQKKIMLLDNSLNTSEDHFINICNQLIEKKLQTDFNQGLDIRYITDSQAKALSRVRLWKQVHFAWDNIGIEKSVVRGIEILKKHMPLSRVMFYVLIGFNTTPEEDLYRVETLRKLGVDPFVMPYVKHDDYQRRFARWVNHKAIFKTVQWEQYA